MFGVPQVQVYFNYSLELAPDALVDEFLIIGIATSDCLSLGFAKSRGR